MKKLQSIPNLKKTVWRLCSEYIRRRDTGFNFGRCITCQAYITYDTCDAGHYIHGNTKATWLLPDNIHGQCKRCNLYLSGNGVMYSLKMIDKYGRERVDELHKLGKSGHVFNRGELEERKEFYQSKLKEL